MKAKAIEKIIRIYIHTKGLLGTNREKFINEIQNLALTEKWEFAKAKCLEQRGICTTTMDEHYLKEPQSELGNKILDTQTPDFK